jgi:hypothetical protein
VGTSSTVDIPATGAYVLKAADFGFSDPDDAVPDAFAGVHIATLPGSGRLQLGGVAVTAGQFVTAADIAAGRLKFFPAAGAAQASFGFQVQDDGSTDNGGQNVDPVRRILTFHLVPAAVDDIYATNENAVVTVGSRLGVLANDSNPGGGTIKAVLTAAPQHGTVKLNPDGSGNDTFKDAIDKGSLRSPAATVTINVVHVSQAPVGISRVITLATTPGQAYALRIVDFGFSDPNDHPADVFNRVKIASQPSGGVLRLAGKTVKSGDYVTVADIRKGKLTFTPAANAKAGGRPYFKFQVEDSGTTGHGGKILDPNPKSLTFNYAAVAISDLYTTKTNTTLKVTASKGVLHNDKDVYGDALKAVLLVAPQHGRITLGADGGFIYKPDAGFVGDDTFSYRDDDGVVLGEQALVTIRVKLAIP